ncbi:MAG: element excision factor XisH family protein [Cyanobacteria bacterium J06634_5]
MPWSIALKLKEPDRLLYLGVSLEIYESFFGGQLSQLSLKEYQIKVVVFNPEDEVIVQWIT